MGCQIRSVGLACGSLLRNADSCVAQLEVTVDEVVEDIHLIINKTI